MYGTGNSTSSHQVPNASHVLSRLRPRSASARPPATGPEPNQGRLTSVQYANKRSKIKNRCTGMCPLPRLYGTLCPLSILNGFQASCTWLGHNWVPCCRRGERLRPSAVLTLSLLLSLIADGHRAGRRGGMPIWNCGTAKYNPFYVLAKLG